MSVAEPDIRYLRILSLQLWVLPLKRIPSNREKRPIRSFHYYVDNDITPERTMVSIDQIVCRSRVLLYVQETVS